MNLSKSYEFFKPDECKEAINIIGCGAIGSTIAENLARLGLTKIRLYDFDIVTAYNVANQMYRDKDIGRPKVEALKEIICEINPDIEKDIEIYDEPYVNQKLSGYVFLGVDNIETRKKIVEKLKNNIFIKAVFDFRMGLTEAQHYAANWEDSNQVDNLLKTMNFTHEEAKENLNISACNMTLSVCPTIRTIVAYGVSNFMNFHTKQKLKTVILIDAFNYTLDVF